MLARAAHHDGKSGAAPRVDFVADAVVVAVGMPMEGEQAMRAAQGELGPAQRDVILAPESAGRVM